VIDLGPEGGDGGGEIVAWGPPEDIVKAPRSYTGKFLKPMPERCGRLAARRAKRRSRAIKMSGVLETIQRLVRQRNLRNDDRAIRNRSFQRRKTDHLR
jgi:hypothetical protein